MKTGIDRFVTFTKETHPERFASDEFYGGAEKLLEPAPPEWDDRTYELELSQTEIHALMIELLRLNPQEFAAEHCAEVAAVIKKVRTALEGAQ